ncbi:MAG: penicillin acylase family protein [Deltaproteobacteria bacterium]|nr:penicillin acylase family protein [Deltaproteobacteria bacterium]
MGSRFSTFVLVGAWAVLAVACGDDDTTQDAGDTGAADVSDETATGETTATDTEPDSADTSGPSDEERILGVPESERWTIPGLTGTVHVVRTEGDVPNIYAENEADLARVLGFVQARDRFFFMDLQRRLGQGRLSELLGDIGLANDIESRGTGMAYITDRLLEHMSPEHEAYLEAYVAGINAYIDAVRAGEVPAPSETSYAPLLGFAEPADMMAPFTVRDVMSFAAVFMSSTNFERGDVGQTAAALRLEALFDGALDAELRKAGYLGDIWDDVRPLFPGSNSADGFGRTGGATRTSSALSTGTRRGRPARAPLAMIEELDAKLRARELRLGRDREAGFGSNAWAVMGTRTKDGKTLLANDGHLELTVPSLGYGAHLDTRVFGGGDVHLHGGWLGNFPAHVGGSNGDVAFGGVNPVLDITDWYAEEIQLEGGLPAASRFGEAWQPLVAVDEDYVVAKVDALGSVGRTETWTRWTTFDGRWITSIEGRRLASLSEAAEGDEVINLLGTLIVPGDTDDDGKITAISFDYVAFDATRWPEALRRMGRAKDVDEVRAATKGFVGAALFTAAADRHGNVLYTSYQAVPCRGYLGPQGGAVEVDGDDPTMLLDGTRFGGFTVPTTADGEADEAPGATDPYKCVVPFERMPHAINPTAGFIFTANNDPGGLTDDGDHMNDEFHLGGPWDSVRANTIRRELAADVAANEADADAMTRLQANKTSRLGELFVPHVVAAVAHARGLAMTDGPKEPHEERLAALYTTNEAALEEAAGRLDAWLDAGAWAASGVETFYETPSAQDLEDSVATMIFNAWIGRFIRAAWDDEGIGAWRYSDSREKVTALVKFLDGRGAGNPGELASWNEATGEAVFFDRLGTPEVERADELIVGSLVEAIGFLAGPAGGEPGTGGFATADMRAWLWGLRHQAKLESVFLSYAGSNPLVASLFADYSISTARVPLADDLPSGDPRRGLVWFPRGGDQWAVDAANPGFSATSFSYGSGPAMRVVYALDADGVEGFFILPGGQSGVLTSPHYDDQVRLWLGNQAMPVRFSPADVAAGATGREVYTAPAPE